jgi:hypothetical protein
LITIFLTSRICREKENIISDVSKSGCKGFYYKPNWPALELILGKELKSSIQIQIETSGARALLVKEFS